MRIAVLGGGSWGTALAKLLSESDHQTTMWVHNPEVCGTIAERRENTVYLPGFPLPASLGVTNSLAEVLEGAELVLYVSPSHVAREVLTQARPLMLAEVPVVSASYAV